jgi:hypothetical protein
VGVIDVETYFEESEVGMGDVRDERKRNAGGPIVFQTPWNPWTGRLERVASLQIRRPAEELVQ